jgi:hypothetical protein
MSLGKSFLVFQTAVLKCQEPITEWHNVISQKNKYPSYTTVQNLKELASLKLLTAVTNKSENLTDQALKFTDTITHLSESKLRTW